MVGEGSGNREVDHMHNHLECLSVMTLMSSEWDDLSIGKLGFSHLPERLGCCNRGLTVVFDPER